jgi:SAM-dependent methyltransferase
MTCQSAPCSHPFGDFTTLPAMKLRLRPRNDGYFRLHPRWSSIDEMVAASAKDGLVSIDLGCGFVKPPGFIGFDDLRGIDVQEVDDNNAPDVLMDLSDESIPLPDGSCDEIRASHFLEHSRLDHVFREAFRLLRPGGTFFFVVPYANSADGMSPGHNIFLTERFFEENIQFQERFEIVKMHFEPSEVWAALPDAVRDLLPFDQARVILFNVCDEMAVWATPRKPSAAPFDPIPELQ